MIFTVELRGGFDTAYRLQTDGQWRKMERDYSLREDDFKTSDPREVIRRTPYGTEILIDHVQYKVSPTVGQLAEVLSGDSMVFRRGFPSDLPNKEQLQSVISTGDDEHHNSLILNLYGKFELRQRPPFDINRNDPSVVVRHETFASGNNYVGLEASKDTELIDRLFHSSLQKWADHLKTGSTQEYVGVPATKPIDEIYDEIRLLKEQWIPAY
jgi:hypothetical protein